MRMTTVLYVHRNLVGEVLPFDKLYFFHKDDETHIPRIFSNAFVIPVNQALEKAVHKVLTHDGHVHLEKHPFSREQVSEANTACVQENILRILENREQFVVAIPVLFTSQKPKRVLKELEEQTEKDSRSLFPQYLCGSPRKSKKSMSAPSGAENERYQRIRSLMTKMAGVQAYFIYAGETYRPLCLLCPHSIDSVVGSCVFGSNDCYWNLGQIGKSDFSRGVAAYKKHVALIDEPEISLMKEKVHG